MAQTAQVSAGLQYTKKDNHMFTTDRPVYYGTFSALVRRPKLGMLQNYLASLGVVLSNGDRNRVRGGCAPDLSDELRRRKASFLPG
jgi:hypothetical protein